MRLRRESTKPESGSQCWICRRTADSAEHKFKRTDIVRVHGPGPFDRDDEVGHWVDGQVVSVQGPNSKRFKYGKSLCNSCNSGFTQPFDKAYDKFMEWVFQNAETVLAQRLVDLTNVFGSDGVGNGCPELYKFFVKSFGCRLVDAEKTVPRDLRRLLKRDRFLTRLRITMAVNRSMFYIDKELSDRTLGLGGLQSTRDRRGKVVGFVWHQQISWLRIGYWYREMPWPRHGPSWTSDGSCIYLGDIESVPQGELLQIVGTDAVLTDEKLNAFMRALSRRDPSVPETYPSGQQEN